jgi:S1-C subfamily serine protease
VVLAGAKLYSGALVSSVEPGGPAAKAGVKGGEQIVSVGGHSTPDAEALRGRLARYSPGQKVQLVLRQANGRTWTKTVTLGG